MIIVGLLIAGTIEARSGSTGNTSVPQTHMGLTAYEWHAKLVEQRHAYQQSLNKTASRLRTVQQAYRRKLVILGGSTEERNLNCIHGYEGAWNDPNGPYYGGLQMDLSFQRAYGAEFLKHYGTADHWPVAVQIAVAIRAMISGRGYYPWPNTARFCHLIS